MISKERMKLEQKMALEVLKESSIVLNTSEYQNAEYFYGDEPEIRKAEKYDMPFFLQTCIAKALDVSLLDVDHIRPNPKAINGVTFCVTINGNSNFRYHFEGSYEVGGGNFKLTYKQVQFNEESDNGLHEYSNNAETSLRSA